MGQDGLLSATRIDFDQPVSVSQSMPIYTRIEKRGTIYTFKYRHDPNEAWTSMAPREYTGTPTYVGLIARVFNGGPEAVNMDWGSFRLETYSGGASTTGTPTATPTQAYPDVPVTIGYTYDKLNRLTDAAYTDGRSYHYTYDAVGNRLTAADQYSTTTYTYDAANRLASVNGAAYIYDADGNLTSNGTTSYAYDSANRLVSASNAAGTTTYAYDGLGNRLQMSYTLTGQATVTTTYVMDGAAGLSQVLDDGTNAYL